jgi:hypothetical protein
MDMNRRTFRALALMLVWVAGAALATEPNAELEAIKAEIAHLKAEYAERLGSLERRLNELEARAPQEAAESATELGDVQRAAREAAGLEEPLAATAPPPPAAGERSLNRLNPEISFTGIGLATASDVEREQFELGEFELDLQAALDPFSRTRWTLAFRDEEVEIEEGYVLYNALGRGLELLGGRFRQRFGALNRQHLHALPQSDYPLVLGTFFGDEGLRQTGLSLTWLPRRPLAGANELTLEITNAENEVAFGGEDFDELSLLGHLVNYWDLSPAAYFEWGLSGAAGSTPEGGDSRVWGTDFTYSWQPPARAKYRGLAWRAELLLSQRDLPSGERQDSWGGYTYLEGLAARNLFLGVRFDRVQDPLDDERMLTGWVPYVTWWQSEFVRIRAEYGLLEERPSGNDENRFTLQLTWAAGPHKHTTY